MSARVLCGIFCATIIGRLATAAPVVLTFDEFSHRTALIAQYKDLGVTFINQPTVLDYDLKIIPPIPGFAHSGTKGVEQCFLGEICTAPLEWTFTAEQRRVKAWVGVSFDMVVPVTVALTGFNAQDQQVARATLDLGTGYRMINTPLEVTSSKKDIVRAAISVLVDGQQGSTGGIAIDDIEFDTEGPPPVCPATANATVGLIQPANNSTTQIGSFLLQGIVTSDAPLEEATLTLVRPDGTSSTGDLISAGLVQVDAKKFGPVRCSPLVPGANRVRVGVKNCFGGTSFDSIVFYNPIPAGTKLILKNIQFQQTIQDMSNLVPLIAQKRTVARVFLQLSTASATFHQLANVSATMTATDSGGTPMGGPLSIRSLNAVTVSDAPDPAGQFKLEATLNFELPPEWIEEGTIHTHLEKFFVEGEQKLLPCQGCDVPFQFGVARFETAPPLRVVVFDVPWSDDGGVTVHTPAATHFDHMASWLRRAYPTADVRITKGGSLARFNGRAGVDFDCNDVNARLSQRIAMCNCDPQTHFYGLVDDDAKNGYMRGCSQDIPSRVASGPAGDLSSWDNDGSYADFYAGHELGHTYGRLHPGVCGESSDDDDYPYSEGRIGNSQAGFDVGDATLGISMAVLSPGLFTDVMTYCQFRWLSDYTYKGILARLRAIEASSGGGSVDREPRKAPPESLMIQGRIDLATGQVTLRPFLRLEGLTRADLPDASPFTIELRDSAATTLTIYPFAVSAPEDPEPDEPASAGGSQAAFDVVVPWEAAARSVVILKDGQPIASRSASQNPPLVHLDSVGVPIGFPEPVKNPRIRVEWTGTDADADQLTYVLQYTNDGGRNWIAIDTGLTVSRLDVPLTRLPGGDLCAFRIVASDGFLTASDVQDAPMAIPNKSPTARILSPQSGIRITSDEPLVLRGEGNDLEDGTVSGADLIWSTEGPRILGTGAAISVSDLGLGLHTVALVARDSVLATGSDSIQVEVLPAVASAIAEVDSPVAVGSSVFLDGSASTGQGVLAYKWSILEKPAGSAAEVVLDEEPVAKLTVDRAGTYSLRLVVTDSIGQASVALPVVVAVSAVGFRRGEVTGDQALDISDPVRILGWMFTGGDEPTCLKAADASDDGSLDLSDPVLLLNFMFLGGRAPEAPFPGCGSDPTPDDGLSCAHPDCR